VIKLSTSVAGIDPECEHLCGAMNKIPGIRTVESCCGHGEVPYRIWFEADSVPGMAVVMDYLSPIQNGEFKWDIVVDSVRDRTFYIQSMSTKNTAIRISRSRTPPRGCQQQRGCWPASLSDESPADTLRSCGTAEVNVKKWLEDRD